MRHTKLIFSILIGMNFSLNSCTRVFFSRPQPLDAKNIYKFPRAFRGVWVDGQDTGKITKNSLMNISYLDKQIAKNELDSQKYLIKNGKIYNIDREKELKLSQGVVFKFENDTLFFKERKNEEVFLSSVAFLRKVDKNYILNIKRENDWWEIFLLSKSANGGILIKNINAKDLNKIADFKLIDSVDDSYFSDAAWTVTVLKEEIDRGLFSDTLLFFDKEKKQ